MKSKHISDNVIPGDAPHNLEVLRKCNYPGRGLVVGLNEGGTGIRFLYFITGRSTRSRNRKLVQTASHMNIKTAFAAETNDDPSLVIYNAWSQNAFGGNNVYVASNGDHTDLAVGLVENSATKTLASVLGTCLPEPDSNQTPRIVASLVHRSGGKHTVEMGIIRRAKPGVGSPVERAFWSHPVEGLIKGVGLCLTTYEADSPDPSDANSLIPSFRGGPFEIPLGGDLDSSVESLWEVLPKAHKVCLFGTEVCLKDGGVKTVIKNRYPETAGA